MSEWVSDDVTANGIKLHYYRTGGDKLPLVLAHGITDNGLCWTRAAEVLANNYDVIMFDARGHGLSEHAVSDFTCQTHAEDLAAFVVALGLEKPVIIGHSMGGANTAMAAALYPDLAGAVILEDPAWRASLPDEEIETVIETWQTELAEYQSQSLERIISLAPSDHPRWKAVNWHAWAEAKLQVNPAVLQQYIQSLPPFSEWGKLIPQIACPILLITGDPEQDIIVTPDIAQTVTELSDKVEVASIKDAGHCIRREQLEPYMSVIGKYLRNVYV